MKCGELAATSSTKLVYLSKNLNQRRGKASKKKGAPVVPPDVQIM